MDAIDRRIVAELRADGRLSNVELAERVGLTPAPCLRRVKRLEDDGVIIGYTALLDPVAMGHAFEVLVNVDLTHKDRDTVERFEAEVAALDEVIEVRRMFGLPDYWCASARPTWTPSKPSSPPGSGQCRESPRSTRTSR